jgi:uncharacterized protein
MLPAIGYALRDENRPYVDDPAWTGIEIDFQRASHPLRTDPCLAGLRFDYVSVHALELSVCSPQPPNPRYLDALVEVAEENGAVAITDHLGFTHAQPGGASVGHVMTPPLTEEALDATCRNIDHIQRRFGHRRLFIENLAHFFLLPGTMDEAEFLSRMLRRTGCGLLLDVTNAFANQWNFKTDAAEFIRAVLPAAERVQMHLAGGYYDEHFGRYIDSHSEPVPQEVWDLYTLALGLARGKIDAVFIERDWRFPSETAWRSELHRARDLAQIVESRPCAA